MTASSWRLAEAWRPPGSKSLSQWADDNYHLSAESAAEPGPWTTLPYQRGVMDAITDPEVERVTWMKSARVGATKILNATIGYFMDEDPCPIMVVQPTVEDAEGYSREEIAPMLRDCPTFSYLHEQQGAKKSGQTLLHKWFPGGSLSMVGANSPRGFRRVSRRVVLFDEVDGYPPSAGAEGDQIRLGIKRTEWYWNRKIVCVSTPTIAGVSRIEPMFESGDQRRYYVPCPHCGHEDFLVFRQRPDGRGHFMQWPKDEPEAAYFVCGENGCIIEERDRFAMLEAGEWIAECEFFGHASFHIWAAYSTSPNAAWGELASEFLDAKAKGHEALKTFVNTVLGETWQDRGEAPDHERLYQRRETYPIGSIPAGVRFLTSGVDVQKDRLMYEVTGWGLDKRSWLIEAGILWGDTSDEKTWAQLDDLLDRSFPGESQALSIAMMAVDSGYNTQQVYAWCRRHPMSRVIACKGSATARTLIGSPSPVDVTIRGRRLQRGYKVWLIGVSIAKAELYGWLRLKNPIDGEDYPPGFCHFPEVGEDYFRQLTAEQLVTIQKKRTRQTVLEWQVIPGRENHFLDCRILSRAAASLLGIDRALPPRGGSKSKQAASGSSRQQKRKEKSWLRGGRKGDWLKRRR